METISLPIHIPTAIGIAIVFLAVWCIAFFVRHRRPLQKGRGQAPAKRRNAKKRSEAPAPVAQ